MPDLRMIGAVLAVLAVIAAPPCCRAEENGSLEARLREDVQYLASDELEGRGPQTGGIDRAAEYIAEQFARAGLKTDIYDGGPFQKFYLSRRYTLGPKNTAGVTGPDGQRVAWKQGEDFTPLTLGGAGRFDLPLVFAGYGISAPDLGYDDYAGIDVRGKGVIVLRREPQQDDPQSKFDGTRNSAHAALAKKLQTAERLGAAVVIFCTDAHSLGTADNADEDRAANALDPLLAPDVGGGTRRSQLPALHVRRELIDRLLRDAGAPSLLEFEQRVDRQGTPASCDLPGWRITGETTLSRTGKALKNVVAILPGKGELAAESLVLGAHYDHLGMGGDGSLAPWTVAVHNGADDNASGTAVLLEVARRLALNRARTRRTLVFIAFSAEEMGLIGSERYLRSPATPLASTVAMLNLDMVGRLREDRLTVYGVGTAAEFQTLIEKRAKEYAFAPRLVASGFGPSDHATFAERGVPVLHFFTGLHSDYHRPSDDAETLNYAGMSQIAEFVIRVAEDLATAPRRPTPRKTSVLADFELDEPSLDDAADPRPARPRRAFLGVSRITPTDDGLFVARLTEDGPAERAGVRAGDVLLQLDGQALRGAQDLVDHLKTKKPADAVALQFRRGELRLELRVILGSY